MYVTDIERLMAQAKRIDDSARELIDDVEVLEENGVDPSTASGLATNQSEFQDDLEVFALNILTLLERSNVVAGIPEYLPPDGSFSMEWDVASEEVTITYSGSVDVPTSDVTVTVAGSEQTPFVSNPITTNDTAIIDTTDLVADDLIIVEWVAHEDESKKKDLPNDARSPVDKSKLSGSTVLVPGSRTFDKQFRIYR